MFSNLNKKKIIIFSAVGLVLIAGITFLLLAENSLKIIQGSDNKDENLIFEPHPLTGQKCENYNRRPLAVMLAVDSVARPLSSISVADVVVEMPVVKDSINRFMGIYVCNKPEEIGSVRSARHDFIPLAAGFDAIYAHWGGSNFALDDLNQGVIDNIDALINLAEAFYRKSGFVAPHNGFTSYERLLNSAQHLGYRLETNFAGYPHIEDNPREGESPTTLAIGYPSPYNVSYIYNQDTNSYLRWRGGSSELDRITAKQVDVKVVVVLKTTSRQINADYNDVSVTGSGEALIFQNGRTYPARWEKGEVLNSKLKFIGENGEEINFVRGKMWINYVDIGTEVIWGEERLSFFTKIKV